MCDGGGKGVERTNVVMVMVMVMMMYVVLVKKMTKHRWFPTFHVSVPFLQREVIRRASDGGMEGWREGGKERWRE